jgi:group I intron endonuclease
MDHIKGRDSNLRLQRSIKKYGLNSFNIVIYYFHNDPAVLLTDIETTVISAFSFSQLLNFKKEASSMLGYKHTKQAIAKMKARFVNKKKHPMCGKTHSESSKYLMSKPGKFNPMFGRTHSEVTKQLMSIKKSIIPLGLYDENNNFIDRYSNQVELANKLGVHKTTISKYIKTGKLFKNKFYIKKLINNKT